MMSFLKRYFVDVPTSYYEPDLSNRYHAASTTHIPSNNYTFFDLPRIRTDGNGNSGRRMRWSLLLDVLFLALLFGMTGIFYFRKPPAPYFTLNDPSLSKPFVPPSIPSLFMFVFNWIIPMVLLTILETVFFGRMKWNILYVAKGFLETMGITVCISAFIWMMYPGLRPNFYAVCQPFPDANPSVNGHYTMSICQGGRFMNRETLHGFPSGHASTAFAAWTYITLYLVARLKPFDGTGHLWKFVLSMLLPLCFATWVSMSRVTDFQHSVAQVVAGALIGIFIAFVAYRINHVAMSWHPEGHITVGIYWKHVAIMANRKATQNASTDNGIGTGTGAGNLTPSLTNPTVKCFSCHKPPTSGTIITIVDNST